MADAICVRCGHAKSKPWATCERCGLDPVADEEVLVKSVYLSTGRFVAPEEKARYRGELDRIGAAIEGGAQPAFIDAELVRLRAQRGLVKQIPPSTAWGAVLRLFLPAIGLLILLFSIAYVVRIFK